MCVCVFVCVCVCVCVCVQRERDTKRAEQRENGSQPSCVTIIQMELLPKTRGCQVDVFPSATRNLVDTSVDNHSRPEELVFLHVVLKRNVSINDRVPVTGENHHGPSDI